VSVLDKVRRWIDGESAELVLEEAARNAQVKPRSQAEEFIVKIARAVEEVMQRELVPLPQGTTIIPTEYIIFLSENDDKDWQGVKRRGLEQGLYHILAERAKEIAGKRKLETKSFVIELRVDGTLVENEVRVQHSWDDSSSNKTGVLSRPKAATDSNAGQASPVTQASHKNPANSPNFVSQQNFHVPSPNFGAHIPPANQHSVPQVTPIQNEEHEIMTHVQKRQSELYRLEVWRGGVRQNVIPISKNEINIGRGSRSKPVDVTLEGDPEISRHHVSLIFQGDGQFSLVNIGRNPSVVNGYELPIGQRATISAGTPISICSYLLRIQLQ
jgi:hypothetical protein